MEELLTLYSQGKIDDMLQRMPIVPAAKPRRVWEPCRELISLTSIAGRYLGFDIINAQSLTERYHEVYVLAYFEKEPILFEFGFVQARRRVAGAAVQGGTGSRPIPGDLPRPQALTSPEGRPDLSIARSEWSTE